MNFGRYEVIRELGRGGMATVYLGHDPSLDRDVAVKVLPRQFVQDDTFRRRFEREARAIGRLRNEAVVQVYDFGEEDGQPYLVMEYMPGGTLADRLVNGALPPGEVVRILEPVASALDSAHAIGLIHRDVKPANILFDADGNAHIADFGISRMSAATQSLTQAHVLGTPAYMSPEQCEGDKELTPASDIYSLGVVAYEMLTGRLPFVSESPFAVMRMHMQDAPRVPSGINVGLARFDASLLEALAKNSLERPAAARDVVDGLREAITNRPASTVPSAPIRDGRTVAVTTVPVLRIDSTPKAASRATVASGSSPVRRSRAAIVAVVGFAVALVASVGVGLALARSGTASPEAEANQAAQGGLSATNTASPTRSQPSEAATPPTQTGTATQAPTPTSAPRPTATSTPPPSPTQLPPTRTPPPPSPTPTSAPAPALPPSPATNVTGYSAGSRSVHFSWASHCAENQTVTWSYKVTVYDEHGNYESLVTWDNSAYPAYCYYGNDAAYASYDPFYYLMTACFSVQEIAPIVTQFTEPLCVTGDATLEHRIPL